MLSDTFLALDGTHSLDESFAMSFVFISYTLCPILFPRMSTILPSSPYEMISALVFLILATWMLGTRWSECQSADIAVRFHSHTKTGKRI